MAQNELGECYFTGRGVKQDMAEAVKYYRKAADQGLAEAQYNLGYCYDNANGVDLDTEKAIELYRKAAKQGHVKAKNALNTLENK